jgi:hypothetical protein
MHALDLYTLLLNELVINSSELFRLIKRIKQHLVVDLELMQLLLQVLMLGILLKLRDFLVFSLELLSDKFLALHGIMNRVLNSGVKLRLLRCSDVGKILD